MPGGGVLLMVLYAVGHSVLLVGTGIGYSYVDRAIKNPRYAAAGVWLRRILGVVILAFGILLIFAKNSRLLLHLIQGIFKNC